MRGEMGGERAEALCTALDGSPSVSIRFNPYKISEKPQGAQVPWCRYGFMLDERPVFTLDPLLHAGAYYVQDSSSMFIEHLMRSAWGDCEGLRVLDMSAAPGGKTTLLAALVGLEGLIVANEPVRQRVAALCDNVQRWGLGNVVVTAADPAGFGALEGFFDCVVVDAPCSGEGMFRKDPAARAQWSENNVALCAARQKRILADAWRALRRDGTLIYSTCTFNRAENEDNVAWLASQFDCEGVEVEMDPGWGIVVGEVECGRGGVAGEGGDGGEEEETGVARGIATFRFYPERVPGEGFFAAVVRKTEGTGRVGSRSGRATDTRAGTSRSSSLRSGSADVGSARAGSTGARSREIFSPLQRTETDEVLRWVGQPEHFTFSKIGANIFGYYAARFDDVRTVAGSVPAVYSGVMMGQVYGGGLRPEHPLALFHDLRRDDLAVTELELGAALDYLRLRELDPAPFCQGINLVTHNDFPLGWAKRIDARINNMLPKELRIRDL